MTRINKRVLNMERDTILDLRKFVSPEIVYGQGALDLAGRYAANLGAGKILLVSDPGVSRAGWLEKVRLSLSDASLAHTVFTDVTPNPRSHEVMRGAEVFLAEGCDFLLAVGGGSPMDLAKGIGVVAACGGDITDYEGVDRVDRPIPPLVCIPTTAGSAAEVSQFAIINVPERKAKIAIVSKALVPDLALISPETTLTMTDELTSCTALDALTHAIEAYVSNASSPLTDLHAREAIRLVGKNLIPCLEDPQNLVLRSRLMLASMEAGLAFSNAILGAVHAMAHSLGGLLDLPHGQCNALLLEHVVEYNYSHAPSRYETIAQLLGVQTEPMNPGGIKNALCSNLRKLRVRAGVNSTLGQLGVTKSDIPRLAALAKADACLATNPKPAKVENLEAIYERAL